MRENRKFHPSFKSFLDALLSTFLYIHTLPTGAGAGGAAASCRRYISNVLENVNTPAYQRQQR
jgi:hypothetical protein